MPVEGVIVTQWFGRAGYVVGQAPTPFGSVPLMKFQTWRSHDDVSHAHSSLVPPACHAASTAASAALIIMVRGHFLGGYLRPDIAAWILQGCLDDSYHATPAVCHADDYPLRGHNGSAMRSATARRPMADHGERMKAHTFPASRPIST